MESLPDNGGLEIMLLFFSRKTISKPLILDIHKMEPVKEQELMTRIEAVIYPDREIKIPEKKKSPVIAEKQQDYSPPMQKLVDEHILIKRWLALIPSVVETLDLTTAEGVQVVKEGVDLIRFYADRLHHAKEENILFKYFDDTAEIFQVIYEDHKQARKHVKEMLAAIESGHQASLAEHLTAYGTLLAEHVKKEDEILFPWLDRKLSEIQVGEIAEKFDFADQHIGIDPEKYLRFVCRLEKQFGEKI
jgi:hemerythrin-like domain-containing protein